AGPTALPRRGSDRNGLGRPGQREGPPRGRRRAGRDLWISDPTREGPGGWRDLLSARHRLRDRKLRYPIELGSGGLGLAVRPDPDLRYRYLRKPRQRAPGE